MRTLVLEGGGMRGSYTAGVLAAFNEAGISHNYFDNYVGTSAGALIECYFLTDQISTCIRIMQDTIAKKLVTMKNIMPRFDITYGERVMRELEPLDINTLKLRKQKAFLPLTLHKTMATEYFCVNTYKDPIKLLLANSSFPFLSKPIVLDGKTYYDGGISALIPLQKAKDLKSDEIWVVCNTPPGYRRKRWKYWLSAALTFRKPGLRKLLLSRPKRENSLRSEIEESKKFIVIRPEKPLPINWLSRDRDKVRKAIELGMEAAEKVLKERGLLKENLK